MSRKHPATPSEGDPRFEAALDCLREVYGDLARENRILREDPEPPAPAELAVPQQLEQKIARLEAEKTDLEIRLGAANSSLKSGSQEDLLTNLYVAGYHLHRALDLQSVLTSVKEILLNLVGAEAFAVYLIDGSGASLTQVADELGSPPVAKRIPVGEGIVGVVAKTGISYFDGERQSGDFHNPVACVPLKAEEHLLGVIQVHRLFTQKKSLTPQDSELFTLLAETAGTALLTAMLRRRYLQPEGGAAVKWGDLFLEVAEDGLPGGERSQA